MNKYLILSCNTGEGHNTAAASIKNYFEEKGLEVVVKDSLSFWSPEKSKIISRGHIFLYRNLPMLFGLGYKLLEEHRIPKIHDESIIYELVTRGCEELLDYLIDNEFSGVICTHLFSALMMTKLKKEEKISIPSYFVSTDYTCYPGTNESDCDAFFIPHSALTDEFLSAGFSGEKIVASGIPIKPEFYTKYSKDEAKALLGLDKNERIVLLTSGSMGCGPMKSMALELCERLPKDTRLVVICGNNERLFSALSKEEISNMTVVGFTKNMSVYMDAADLILTKAGGLSSTEAAVKALPIFFINAIPGCETKNRSFFVSRGFAATAEKEDELISLVCKSLENPEKLHTMSEKMQQEFTFCAAEEIYKYICKEGLTQTL